MPPARVPAATRSTFAAPSSASDLSVAAVPAARQCGGCFAANHPPRINPLDRAAARIQDVARWPGPCIRGSEVGAPGLLPVQERARGQREGQEAAGDDEQIVRVATRTVLRAVASVLHHEAGYPEQERADDPD